jgi:hypothetical protein
MDGDMKSGHPNRLLYRWSVAALVVVAVLTTGCPRVLHLNYQASTSIKGSGPIQVNPFIYAGHTIGLMKSKELESTSHDSEALYLSQDISVFFSNALKAELTLAGYEVQSLSTRTVSGTIEHLFLDYVGETSQLFRIQATFEVMRNEAPSYASSCHADRRQVTGWMKSGLLIEQGVRDCLGEFLRDAQAAGAL